MVYIAALGPQRVARWNRPVTIFAPAGSARASGPRRVRDVIHTNEVMSLRRFEPAQVKALLLRNQIRDGLSLTGLLWHFGRIFSDI